VQESRQLLLDKWKPQVVSGTLGLHPAIQIAISQLE
jgi:hypothetical protein